MSTTCSESDCGPCPVAAPDDRSPDLAGAAPDAALVRTAGIADAAAIAAIYAPYVDETIVSFEEQAPSAQDIAARIAAADGLYPWLVAERDGALLGYAYAAAFRSRSAYRFAVETTVYLRRDACGRGLGGLLYRPLIARLEGQGFTQAIAAISLPNAASVKLHERLGFVPTGTYRQVGWKLGRWIDVGLWQRPLAPALAAPTEPGPVQRR